ncbi:ApeP family dehydratase [Neisseria sp. Ec49-e6-T10]|uniref:ApeP family dehydratase n=1 Tax=Neisseria sp. Ec49-e6-T10 TaxID=3140744 RepID=UPI003EBEBE94
MMNSFLPVADYLPHEAPMVLLDQLYAVDPETIECTVQINKTGVLAPFLNENDHLPAWFLLEIMAQTVGVWNGFHAKAHNKAPQIGLLLGSRAFKTIQAEYPPNTTLHIQAKLLLQDERLANFDCAVLIDQDMIASAKINVFEPNTEEINALLERNT